MTIPLKSLQRPAPPVSPCMKVCMLGSMGYCLGCLRTGDEIARWPTMNAAEQWQLLDRLAERRRHQAAKSPLDVEQADIERPEIKWGST